MNIITVTSPRTGNLTREKYISRTHLKRKCCILITRTYNVYNWSKFYKKFQETVRWCGRLPLCSRRCSQVEDTTIVHWVGVGSALTLVFV